MREIISPVALKELVAANAICSALVIGEDGAYFVTVKYGMAEKVVGARTRQGGVKEREFLSLDAAAKYLRGIGIRRFDVDESRFTGLKKRASRPDRAAALKAAHEAAAYDKWFREQVQEALDDPAPTIPDAEAKAHFAAKRAALRKQIKGERGPA